MLDQTEVRPYGLVPRDQRRDIFGVDCQEQLEWRGWQPGTEYTKSLNVKNVGTHAISLRYKQTRSKAFSMDFPEPFKLRPGMSHPLKVVFRPLKMQHYSDHIEIMSSQGSFLVPVHAYTPATHIEVPNALDFGFVPAKEPLTLPLVVRNTGDVQVKLTWKLDAPFSISPPFCTLPAGDTVSFAVTFVPVEACSYNGQAFCQLESGQSATVLVTGIGKFPYLSLDQSALDFGEVLVGCHAERLVRFGNHSVVPANFTFEHDAGSADDGVFRLTPAAGTLGPNEFSVAKLRYSPRHTGTFSLEHFTLSTPGGNRLGLSLRAMALGPRVTFSASSINFKNVPVNQLESRVFFMQNHSKVPAVYEFQVESGGVFCVSKPRGAVPALSTTHVTVTFCSATPSCFWQRVTCLIKDADPIGLDLIATSYSATSRPPPLKRAHISNYLARVEAGLNPIDPHILATSAPQSPQLVDDGSNGTSHPPAPPSGGDDATTAAGLLSLPMDETQRGDANGGVAAAGGGGTTMGTGLQAGPLEGPDSWELYFEGQDPRQFVALDAASIEFGSCTRLTGGAEHKTVVVTNRTAAKLTAFVTEPLWTDPHAALGAAESVFKVYPASAEIRPHSQASFRVAFRPPVDGQWFCQTLQVVAYVHAMRSYTFVNPKHVVPPWIIPLQASGNTFLHSNPEMAPRVDVSPRAVAFPASRVGDAVHQTVMITNYGDMPVEFAVAAPGSLPPTLTIKPMRGVVPVKGHVLLGVRFKPTDSKPVVGKALLVFNGSSKEAVELVLRGAGHAPRLTFDVNGTLYFRPTCIGASSQRSLTVVNPSRVPVAFRMQLPPKVHGVVAVTPTEGVLRGNESMQLAWTFAPTKQKTYEARATCQLLSVAGSGDALVPGPMLTDSDADVYPTLMLVGEGTQGAITLDPPSIDFGPLKVGTAVMEQVTLINQSDGVLRYSIECGRDDAADEAPAADATLVEFPIPGVTSGTQGSSLEFSVDEPEGAIAARASKLVTVTFFPRYRKQYALQMRVRTSTVALLAPGPNGERPHSGGGGGGMPMRRAGSLQGSRLEGLPADDGSGASSAVVSSVRAATTFPTVTLTDVFCEGVPKHVMWGQFSVNALNAALRSEVTSSELHICKLDYAGTITTEAAERALEHFSWDFGIHAEGAPDVVVHLQLHNPEALPVDWQLHSYDNPDVQLENWIEPQRPRSEAARLRDFISEFKLFEIRPLSGHLQPGAQTTVTLIFRPTHLGAFHMPVFFQMKDGRRLCVTLRATTVSPPVQVLQLLPSVRTFTLAPVPIGEAQPPLQLYTLRNGGPGVVTYCLDVAPLQQLTAENYDFEIIKLCSPPEGEIAAGGVATLNWCFAPLEARCYSVDVPITLGDGRVEVVTLQGRGYHPEHPEESPALAEESTRDWAVWPSLSTAPVAGMASRLVTASHDMLSFGSTILQGVTRRLVVLTNKSRYPMAFTWDLGIFRGVVGGGDGRDDGPVHARLDMSPASGVLDPGERLVCRATLEAGHVPQLFEGEVHCHVHVDDEFATQEFEMTRTRGGLGVTGDNGGDGEEETIAVHPNRPSRYVKGSILKNRLPVHLTMPACTLARNERLATQHATMMGTLTQRAADRARPQARPDPQVITVTLAGRVLTKDHVKADLFTPAHELPSARLLLAGASWVPPATSRWWDNIPLPAELLSVDVALASNNEDAQQQLQQQLDSGASQTQLSGGEDQQPSGTDNAAAAEQTPGDEQAPEADVGAADAAGATDSGDMASAPAATPDDAILGDAGGIVPRIASMQRRTPDESQEEPQQQQQQPPGQVGSDGPLLDTFAFDKPAEGAAAAATGAFSTSQSGQGPADGHGEYNADGGRQEQADGVAEEEGEAAELGPDVAAAAVAAAVAPPRKGQSPLATRAAAAAATARSVLEELLGQLVGDADVRAEFQLLGPAPVPLYAQLRVPPHEVYSRGTGATSQPEAAKATARVEGGDATATAATAPSGAPGEMWPLPLAMSRWEYDWGVPPIPPAPSASTAESGQPKPSSPEGGGPLVGEASAGGNLTGEQSQPASSGMLTDGTELAAAAAGSVAVAAESTRAADGSALASEEEAVATAAAAASAAAAAAKLERTLQRPEFKIFAEFVLESAVLSLMQESAAGDWEAPAEEAA